LLPPRTLRGFFTEELRTGGRRVGFRLQILDGRAATLAHRRFPSAHQVGPYGVDLAALDAIVAAALNVIDEIGKMECLSARFVTAVCSLLDGPVPVLATVSQRGGGFMAAVRERPDTLVWEVTQRNREALPAMIRAWLQRPVATPQTPGALLDPPSPA
jgi:nucleoside-triphosphatase